MEMYVVVDLEGRIARSRWTGVGTVYGDIKEAQAEAKIRNKKRAGVYAIERLSVIASPDNRVEMKKLCDESRRAAIKLFATIMKDRLGSSDFDSAVADKTKQLIDEMVKGWR